MNTNCCGHCQEAHQLFANHDNLLSDCRCPCHATDTAEKNEVTYKGVKASVTIDWTAQTFDLQIGDAPTTDTSDTWRERFDDNFPGFYNSGVHVTSSPLNDIKAFIENELERVREEGIQFGRALEETETEAPGSFEAGRAAEKARVLEVIEEMSDEVRLHSTDVKPIFAKVVFVKRLKNALEALSDK